MAHCNELKQKKQHTAPLLCSLNKLKLIHLLHIKLKSVNTYFNEFTQYTLSYSITARDHYCNSGKQKS